MVPLAEPENDESDLDISLEHDDVTVSADGGGGGGDDGSGGDDEIIIFNIGGQRFEALLSSLLKKPSTRIYHLVRRYKRGSKREFFFDRHPMVFGAIMDFYRSGELHVPLNVCGAVVKRELDFWQIDESLIEPCCWTCYSSYIDNQKTLAEFTETLANEMEQAQKYEQMDGWPKTKMKIWMTLDHPRSSKTAMAIAVASFVFVLASITGFCLETIPSLHYTENQTHFCDGEEKSTPVLVSHPVLQYLDYLCTVFFTTEIVVRIIFAPDKTAFFKSPMNIIDLLALLPLYVQIILDLTQHYNCLSNKRAVVETIFILRIVRIFRIFHLVKHYKALKILVHAIKASTQELLMLSIFLVIAMLVFSTLIFYAESPNPLEYTEDKGDFHTIPIGFWWAIITMTTVGYGDIYPHTPIGYCVGVLCAVWGVLLVALTIPVISNNFSLFYLHARTRESLQNSREASKQKQLQRTLRRQQGRKNQMSAIPERLKKGPLAHPLLTAMDSNSTEVSLTDNPQPELNKYDGPTLNGDATESAF